MAAEMPKKVEEGACSSVSPRQNHPCTLLIRHMLLLAALFYRLKQKAFTQCESYSKAYADCCRGRVVSVVWSCRTEMKELSDCMKSQ